MTILHCIDAGPQDWVRVATLASEIWRLHYRSLLEPGQIDYMLERMYAPAVLEAGRLAGTRLQLLRLAQRDVGFLAVSPAAEPGLAWLDKLYLHPRLHGRGLGQQALTQARQLARGMGAQRLQLRVNRHNQLAIRAYERAGLTRLGEDRADIGHGYVMDDYLYGCSLEGPSQTG